MHEPPVPSPWNRRPLTLLYLALLIVAITALRLLGRGWIGTITAGIPVAGIVWTLLVLLGSSRRRR
jgi:hypothetical protein